MNKFLCFIFFAAHMAWANSPKKPTVNAPILSPFSKLERHCEEAARQSQVGLAVAVVNNNKLSYKKAFGRIKKNKAAPITLDTVFSIGSTSKPLTATLFALAQRQKRISLNTPIALLKESQPQLQVHHILSHQSGYSRNGWNWQIEHGATRAQLLERFKRKPAHAPGIMFDYHNVAFSLIEDMLKQSYANIPFATIMEEQLLKPLGMHRSTVGFAKFKLQSNRAWPHVRAKNGIAIPAQDYSVRYHETVPSAGGINASINDMAQFLLLQFGQFPHILSKDELAKLYSVLVAAPDANRWFKNRVSGDFSCHYGYGWRVLKLKDDVMVFHGGWLNGFSSFMAFSPKSGKGIVLLSNSEGPFVHDTGLDYILGKF